MLEKDRNYKEEVIPFMAGDGFVCNLVHVQGMRPPTRGPVLLVHGAGVRANIFRAPVETTLVDALIENDYDVWLENWRASIDFPPNRWTLDQVALYDHPEAVKTVADRTGCNEIKAIIHCQGSTSFMMSAVMGLTPQVTTIISNAVSLHPIIPALSQFKLDYAVPLARLLTDYLNPQWGIHAPTLAAKIIAFVVRCTHHECDNPVCKQVSFTYGAGWPALWRHENLNDNTHEWLKQEFAHVPLAFFVQIARSVRKGCLVSVEKKPELPADFVSAPPKTAARIAFLAGEKNLCFLPESQQKSFEYFMRCRPGRHTLNIVRDYSHLDIFMGKQAHRDVFPWILEELGKSG